LEAVPQSDVLSGANFDFGIYNFNASDVLGYSVFPYVVEKHFFFQYALSTTRGIVEFYSAGVVGLASLLVTKK
jgi:hypothetical protein